MTPVHISVTNLIDALLDIDVVNFVKKNILQSYKEYYTGYEQQIDGMVNDSFRMLTAKISDMRDIDFLQDVIVDITTRIFHTNNPDFWFNKLYQEYKHTVRPEKDFQKIAQFINGKHILDFGSGGGYLAKKISDLGYNVMTTDVLDYRSKYASQLPFKLMEMPDRLPQYDKSFDIVISKTVFHHIEPNYLLNILDDISNISRRLIIEEDTYDMSESIPGVSEAINTQPQLREFMSLGREKQKKSLSLLDFFANNIALGIVDINCPFQFKTVSEWEKVLYSKSFKLTHVIFSGFERGKMHKNCQVWMICDKI